MSTGTQQQEQQPDATARMLWVLILCSCALMWITFSMPGREGPGDVGELDIVALFKLGVRGIVGLVLLHMTWRLWDTTTRQQAILLLLPWLLFCIWGVVTVSWSPLKTISFGQIASFCIQLLLAVNLALLWRREADTERVLRWLTTMLVLFAGVVVVANLAMPEYGSLDRMNWGVVHPTIAGATASLGLVLLLACRTIWAWRWSRILLIPGVFINTSLLYLAANRAGLFLALTLAVVVFLVYANRALVWSAVMVGCLAAVVYLTADPGFAYLEQGLEQAGGYVARGQQEEDIKDASGRREMWDAVWTSYLDSPVVGHGFFVTSAEGQLYVWNTWGNWTAHNATLQALVSTGIVGTLLIACGVAIPSWRLWRARNHNQEIARFGRLILLVGIWYLIWSQFNESIMGSTCPESVAFFLLLGMTGGYVSCAEADAEPSAVPIDTLVLPGGLGGSV